MTLLYIMDDSKWSFEWKNITLTKNLMPQKILLIVAVPKKLQYSERKLNTLKKQLFGESSCCENHACKSKCLQLLFEKVYCT